jgi:GNAT superfamily N-acetyltransferase
VTEEVGSVVDLRPWNRRVDTVAVQQLSSRLWPLGPHPGGLGWEAAIDQLPTSTMLAESEELVGWAGVTSGALVVQADHSCPDAARALLDWAMAEADDASMAIPVFDGDEVLRRAVSQAGFVLEADAEPVVGMFRPASAEGPRLPVGYRVRAMRDGEDAERVEVHRNAWRPATLPWPAEVLSGVSSDATSRFTAAHFEQVRRAWLYDQDLDLVVEAPDGTLAACCTVWWDPALLCAEIEPLGVVPQHRRMGLATAMCMEAAAQVAARGGDQVFINTGPRPDYPAPATTYVTVGFVVTPRGRVYRKGSESSPRERQVSEIE